MEMYIENQKEKQKADIIAAFYSAYFQRLKTLSSRDLENILTKIDNSGKEMTDEQMFKAFKGFASDFGGED